MRRRLLAAALAAIGLVVTGCSNTQTFASQCAYQIQDGYFDARHVKDILHPGERKNTNNTTVRYVYCNARNYLVSAAKDANVDQRTPIATRTGPGSNGDGTPVNVEVGMHWTLNQNEPTMLQFLGFAEKYGAFASKDASTASTRSASPGWLNMTQENHRFALQRAVQVALLDFKPDVWNDQSKWPAVAAAISAQVKPQMRQQIFGTDAKGNPDYFCGTGVHLRSGVDEHGSDAYTCPDISVTVDNIAPQDSGVRRIYNQQVQQQQLAALADQEAKTGRKQLLAARAKYGRYAEFFLGLIDACKAGGQGGCPSLGSNAGTLR
jgi:hypothetical protein